MAKVPVEPALARALLAGAAGGVLPEIVTVVAMLGCEEVSFFHCLPPVSNIIMSDVKLIACMCRWVGCLFGRVTHECGSSQMKLGCYLRKMVAVTK